MIIEWIFLLLIFNLPAFSLERPITQFVATAAFHLKVRISELSSQEARLDFGKNSVFECILGPQIGQEERKCRFKNEKARDGEKERTNKMKV